MGKGVNKQLREGGASLKVKMSWSDCEASGCDQEPLDTVGCLRPGQSSCCVAHWSREALMLGEQDTGW